MKPQVNELHPANNRKRELSRLPARAGAHAHDYVETDQVFFGTYLKLGLYERQ